MFNFVSNEEKMKNKEDFIQAVLKTMPDFMPTKGKINLMDFVQEESYQREIRRAAEDVFVKWKHKGWLDENNKLVNDTLARA